jgi:hypothetical protein
LENDFANFASKKITVKKDIQKLRKTFIE